jgi:hypothetical protein
MGTAWISAVDRGLALSNGNLTIGQKSKDELPGGLVV